MSNKSGQSDSLLLNIAFNIIIPTLILINLSTSEYLGTKLAVAVALAFPIIYGLKDFIMIKKLNAFSALGVISILLTGGISLLELNPIYIAIKEAAIPAIFGIATLVSLKTPYPLVKTFLYNDKVIQTKRISAIIKKNGSAEYYILAVSIITSQPGTVEFNEQLGTMTALSFPVIAIPAMLVLLGALFYLFRGIKKLTGLQLEEIIQHNDSK
jgi:intracellular septation protein A